MNPAMSDPLVYIITHSWNKKEITLDFLANYRQLTYPHYRLLVVTNGPDDDTRAAVRARFPAVEVVVSEENQGFAAGINRGMRRALDQGADYLFLVNNDTTIAADALTLLVDVAQRAPGIAITAPYVYYAHDPQRLWSSGAGRYHFNMELRDHRRGRRDDRQDRAPHDVAFAAFCGMLIRRACVRAVGLFDEQFFLYHEDNDYCVRVIAAGYRIVLVPEAKMWHREGATVGDIDSPDVQYHVALSSGRFFRKHVHDWRWLIILPYRAASALKTSLRLLARRRWASCRAYWRGLYAGYFR